MTIYVEPESMYDGDHMDVVIINALLHSLYNIFQTMVGEEIEPGMPEPKHDKTARGEVTALIGMKAKNTNGSVSLTLNRATIDEIAPKLMGEEINDFDKDAPDLVGELVNMLAGGAKRVLAKNGLDFDMQTPKLMVGVGHEIEHYCPGQTVIIPVCLNQTELFLELNFVRSVDDDLALS